MTSYRCTFDRIGRHQDVEPLTAAADTADDLAEAIYRYARPKLASREIEVHVDLNPGTGGTGVILIGGFRNGGEITIEEVPAP